MDFVDNQLKSNQLRIVPLGGLGEIGMNCLALEQEGAILLVDCGTNLPNHDLGVDVIHPDFTWLMQRSHQVCGVFLTHGHEDHIGGLPYLLARFPVPIWGPPHALGLVRRRLDEHGFTPDQMTLRPSAAGRVYRIGSFEVEPIAVTHSTVEAAALCITTRAGTVVHTGDFNFDLTPPDGRHADTARLKELGDRGVALLMSDSTNVDMTERQGSELQVADRLRRLVLTASGRVFVTMFSSNLHRLSALGQIARDTGRQVCLLGRSMNSQVAVASALGLLGWPSDLCVSPDQARDLDPKHVLVLAGGSQAEPESALARLAKGTHHWLTVEEGDTVLLSSRIIPGNDRAVMDMICGLLRRGGEVHSALTDPEIHSSGHAGRSELRRMLELVRPRCFVPVHGTLYHLMRHAELARELGNTQVVVVENGWALVLDEDGLRLNGRVPHGPVAIDDGGEPLSAATLMRRAELGRAGLVTVGVVVDEGAHPLASPQVNAVGVPAIDGQEPALSVVSHDIVRALRKLRRVDPTHPAFAEQLRRTVHQRIRGLSGCRPTIDIRVWVVAHSGSVREIPPAAVQEG
ncbi:ribonuclease J [Myxococcota bacterium]